ncbi:MAG: hypothetical protein U0547_04300 [Dehalococcoidia bacterium]
MLTSSRASVHAPHPGANRALTRFVADIVGGIAVIVAFVVIGSRVAGQSSNERVMATLPDAEIADYAPSLWALAENVEALVAASDAVVIGRVTSTSFALEDREFTSGTHAFGDLTAKLRITAALKGDTPAGTLEVRQFAHAFNGKLLVEDNAARGGPGVPPLPGPGPRHQRAPRGRSLHPTGHRWARVLGRRETASPGERPRCPPDWE